MNAAVHRRPNRDLVQQLAAVQGLAAQEPITLDEAVETVCLQLAAVKDQASPVLALHAAHDSGANTRPSTMRRLYSEEDIQAQLAWAKSLRADTGDIVLRALERAQKLGSTRRLPVAGSSLELEQLGTDFPNFREVVDFVSGRAMLCSLAPSAVMRLPPMLLDGPPGTGKTAFCARLAAWLRVPVHHVDMSTMDTAFKITGLDSGYATGKPGLIWEALQAPCMAPVMVLDEIDKPSRVTKDGGLAFLLGLLEPSTATRFKDACIGLSVDASRMSWLATSNDASQIEGPLLSRFRVFQISPPTSEQMRAVIASIWRAVRDTEDWALAFEEVLPHPVVEQLQGRTPRELRQAIEDACIRAAAQQRRRLEPADVVQSSSATKRPMGFLP